MRGLITTHSGVSFQVFNPTPEMVNIEDIAWSLSHLCRFNGHSKRFYSVAEHCVRGSLYCSIENALWFLLHDAAEAYVGDIMKPLKTNVHRKVEDRVLRVIADKYGLIWPMPAEIHEVDQRVLVTEAQELMTGTMFKELMTGTSPYEGFYEVYELKDPFTWEETFLHVFYSYRK